MTTFGEKLRQLMENNNVKQQELADKLNVKRGSVSNWTTNRRCPDAETIVKIADYFNVTVDYLLKDTGIKSNELEELKDLKGDYSEIEDLYESYKELDKNNKILIDSMIKTMLENQKGK